MADILQGKSLEEIRKEIEKANTLLVRAEERVSSLRQQYTNSVSSLKELGITNPKEIENHIKKRQADIQELKNQIETAIPTDIVKKYSGVDFATIKVENQPNLDQPF